MNPAIHTFTVLNNICMSDMCACHPCLFSTPWLLNGQTQKRASHYKHYKYSDICIYIPTHTHTHTLSLSYPRIYTHTHATTVRSTPVCMYIYPHTHTHTLSLSPSLPLSHTHAYACYLSQIYASLRILAQTSGIHSPALNNITTLTQLLTPRVRTNDFLEHNPYVQIKRPITPRNHHARSRCLFRYQVCSELQSARPPEAFLENRSHRGAAAGCALP